MYVWLSALSLYGDEQVHLVLDCWKRVFSLRTLGGGVRRYFLIFTEGRLVELETSHVANVLPSEASLASYMGSTYNDPLSYLFWGAVETIIQEALNIREKEEQHDALIASLSQQRLSHILTFIKTTLKKRLKIHKIEEKTIAYYHEIKATKVEVSGSTVKLEMRIRGKNIKYYAPFGSQERATEAAQKLKTILNIS